MFFSHPVETCTLFPRILFNIIDMNVIGQFIVTSFNSRVIDMPATQEDEFASIVCKAVKFDLKIWFGLLSYLNARFS